MPSVSLVSNRPARPGYRDNAGRRLYDIPLRLLVGEFDMAGEDGPSFVGCKADGIRGPNGIMRFIALDVVNADGVSMLA
jgi:hypothetical protein